MRAEPDQRTATGPVVGSAPWPVKAYVALTFVSSVVWVLLVWLDTGETVSSTWLGTILGIAICIGLLRGYRGAWLVAMLFLTLGVLGAVGLVGSLIRDGGLPPQDWSGFVTWLISIPLLLHPLTRGWVTR